MYLEEIISSTQQKIVAAEPLMDGRAILYARDGDQVTSLHIPFAPWILLSSPALMQKFEDKCNISQLNGSSRYAFQVFFPDYNTYDDALKYLKKSTGMNPSSPNSPYRVFTDLQLQLFMVNQFRLFRGMSFNDTRRMQFDIETVTSDGFEFPNASREGDAIIIITLSDNTGWEKCISMDNMSEKELLQEFVDTVAGRDPDILEGHNIFRFDLPYIEQRAKIHKVKLTLGRDGSAIKKRNSRFSAAERTVNYRRYQAFGRHFIDTMHLVQLYDVIHRDLESYGLKYVAKHFGVAAKNRTYIEGRKISDSWENDRENLLRYAMDDVKETRAISAILSPSYFYQTQLIPISYQNCVVRGNATRIDSMLVAEYLKEQETVPVAEQAKPFAGALTKAFKTGVFKNVWHCDVRSLYPSIILADSMSPSRDSLGVFPRLLNSLRSFRLKAKDAERSASSREENDYYNSLQTTFKILINSFYGYLGFSQGTFNDYAMAEKVTSRGREILTMMLEFIQKEGANVIEMDTDGIYFQPPEGVTDTQEMEKRIQQVLPQGIDVELDSTYPAMFGYKSKNYALLHDNGEITIAGAALKSRGIEPFQRDYIKSVISYLLNNKADKINELTDEYRSSIENRSWPLEKLAKSETLNNSLDLYKTKLASGKGRRSAAYELAINSNRSYSQGDQVSYYIIGEKKKASVVDNSKLLSDASEERDENVNYYLGKLDELKKKFDDFVPEEDTNLLGLEF